MSRQEEEEVGLLPAEFEADEYIVKNRRSRGICGFRPRHRQIFGAMLCFLVFGLALLGILTA